MSREVGPAPERAVLWQRVRERLRAEVGETAFDRWLQGLKLAEGAPGGGVVLSAPTRFLRDWVGPRYGDRLRALWRLEDPAVCAVEIVVHCDRALAMPNGNGNGAASSPPGAEGEGGADGDGQNGHGVPGGLDPKLTFDQFVVGGPNEFAHAAARRVADSDQVAFNPLFLYGGVGLGKTHLMHAIAFRLRERAPQRRVLYLSAETFMYRFIRALRAKNTVEFKDLFRSAEVLMIDDVQFIGGREATQEEFFHTFNALVEERRQVIVSADRSPSDLDGVEERLRSRLGWGLVAEIHAANYELRLGILQAKTERAGASVPPKVLEYLAHRITSNVRELEGALNRVMAHATFFGRAITLEAVEEVLHDLLRANTRRISVEDIQKKVAEYYNIKLSEMSSARRAQMVARPRQVAMYLAKQLTARSLPEIGRKFGNRDHTTVMHAVKRVEQLRQTDPAFAQDVELLRRVLEG